LCLEDEKIAKKLGIPRSQLVPKALQEFITRHTQDNITEDLNKVYSNHQQRAFDSTIEDTSIESIRELTKNDARTQYWLYHSFLRLIKED